MFEAFVYAYFYLIFYSFLGWICESTYVSVPRKQFINRGFFYGPYIPIYGFGSLIALYPLMPFKNNPILIFFFGAFLCSVLEYITSWAMEKLFHMRWWDYSRYKYNINGRVCLLNSSLFGLMLLALVYIIHPSVSHMIEKISLSTMILFLSVFSISFLIDFVFTLISLIRRKQIIDRMRADIEEFQAQFEKALQERLVDLEEKRLEFDEKREYLQIQKDIKRKEFEEWISNQESLQERLEGFHNNMERIKNYRKSHIARAFPERHVSESFKELKQIADEIHAKEKKHVSKDA